MQVLTWTAQQIAVMTPITPMRATYAMHNHRQSRRPIVLEWVMSRSKDWTVSQLADHLGVQPRTAMDWVYQMIAEGCVERIQEGRGGHQAIYRSVK